MKIGSVALERIPPRSVKLARESSLGRQSSRTMPRQIERLRGLTKPTCRLSPDPLRAREEPNIFDELAILPSLLETRRDEHIRSASDLFSKPLLDSCSSPDATP